MSSFIPDRPFQLIFKDPLQVIFFSQYSSTKGFVSLQELLAEGLPLGRMEMEKGKEGVYFAVGACSTWIGPHE